jgi:RNA polymerase sigma factor (sigma-70 family)
VTTRSANRLDAGDLARHGAFLARLARALAHGHDEAEDLVQDTYVAALRHPPDPARPPRPWFAQVMRNLARMRRRGDARQREREAIWQSEGRAVPTPDELYERALTHRALADQLVLLDEPFRRTLLLRFVEGLATARIAELEEIAPATVRWRIKEGLERLRAGLDGACGERGRWMRAILPLPAGAALGRAELMISGGTLIMKMKSKLALVLLALIAAGGALAVVVRMSGEEPGSAGAAPAGSRTEPAAPTRLATGSGEAAPAPEKSAEARPLALIAARAELDPAARRGSIEGQVANWSTGKPVAGAEVVVSLVDAATTTIATDADGRFRFEPDRAGRVVIAAITAPGYLPFAPEWGYSPIELMARPGVRVRDLVIYLIPAIDYTGVVVTPDGVPVAGAEVRIIDLPAREQELVSIPDRFTTDKKGEFKFHAPDFALFEARARGYGPGRARLDQAAAVTHRMTLRLKPSGEADALGSTRVTGVVVDGGGELLPGVLVTAGPRGPEPPPPPSHDGEFAAAGRAVTGPDGRFAIDGLDPGDYDVEAHDQIRTRARAAVTLSPRGGAEVRLVMTEGAVLRGVVRGANGEPVPAFTVLVFEPDTLTRGEVVATRTVVDREGSFSIEGLEARDYRVRATAHGHAPSRPVGGSAVLPPARPSVVEIRLPAGGTLTGTVRSKDGKPLEAARAIVESGLGDGPSPLPFSASAATDEQGRFTLRGLSPGRRSVTIGAYGHHGKLLTGIEVVEGAELPPIEVVLDPLAEGETPTIEIAGIGAALSAADDALLVTQVIPGGGAEAAGLVSGDQIIAVDGRSIVDLGFEDAIQAIRGPVGTTVRLALRRPANPTAVTELSVERVKIRF